MALVKQGAQESRLNRVPPLVDAEDEARHQWVHGLVRASLGGEQSVPHHAFSNIDEIR